MESELNSVHQLHVIFEAYDFAILMIFARPDSLRLMLRPDERITKVEPGTHHFDAYD